MHHFIHLYVTHASQNGQVAVKILTRDMHHLSYSCESKGSSGCEDLTRNMHHFIDLYVTHVTQKGQVAVKI